MVRRRGNSTHGRQHVFLSYFSNNRERLAVCEFAQGGGARHRGNTTLGTEADFSEMAVVGKGAQLKNVAADGIFLSNAEVGSGKFTGVTRVLEMIQESGRVHGDILTPGQKFKLNSLVVVGKVTTMPRSMFAALVPGLSSDLPDSYASDHWW